MSQNSFISVYSLMATEQDFIANRDEVAAFLGDTLKDWAFLRGQASLDLIMELKGGNKRRDGMPAILHEVTQALYTLGLIDTGLLHLEDPMAERLFCINFLHDTGEDFGEQECGPFTSPENCEEQYISWLARRWGEKTGIRADAEDRDVAKLCWRMSKTYGDQPLYRTTGDYYAMLASNPATIIAKCQDRIHNNATLLGSNISQRRVSSYCRETMTYYPAMLEQGNAAFPAYARVFDFLGDLLKRQVRLMERLIDPECEHPGIGPMFAINASFSTPHAINPIAMIVERAGRLEPLERRFDSSTGAAKPALACCG